MPDGWRVHGVDPPGHGSAPGPPLTTFPELVTASADAVRSVAQLPIVLFGHSLGGSVAHDVARRLVASGHPPAAIVLSACVPATDRPRQALKATMDDASLVRYLERTGGTDPSLLADPGFVRYLLAILRADLQALESCPGPDAVSPLEVPTLLLAGTTDEGATPAAVEAWRPSLPRSEIEAIEGGHMFVLSNPRDTALAITAFWERVVDPIER
jgi:surfactin synthase thioesterase subunit